MSREKILIVEDDPTVADLIGRFLKLAGYQVAGSVGSGEQALIEAARLPPDLALMDIGLSGELDGVETAERLHARFDIPVVFLTGLADDDTIRRSREARAFGYLLKPFRQEDLKTSIDLALSKHKAESKLRKIERWYSAALTSIADGVITADEDAIITFLNPVAETLTGWKLDHAQGRPLKEVFRVLPQEGGSGFPSEATLLARDGTSTAVECRTAPIRNNDTIIGTVLIFRDISDRRRAEEELRHSREEFRALAAHLEGIREEERTRLAREIHDELGQMLTGLKMDLAWIDKRVTALKDADARPPLAGKLRSMFGLLDEMMKSARKISAELRPAVLDDLGLAPAIAWLAREWQSRTGIECRLDSDLGELGETGDLAASRELGTACFRILQESLTNVARHSGATRVEIRVESKNGALRLELRDNGRGITDHELRGTKSLGLVGMRERAALLGGEFRIVGVPGQGTMVSVRIPVAARVEGLKG